MECSAMILANIIHSNSSADLQSSLVMLRMRALCISERIVEATHPPLTSWHSSARLTDFEIPTVSFRWSYVQRWVRKVKQRLV